MTLILELIFPNVTLLKPISNGLAAKLPNLEYLLESKTSAILKFSAPEILKQLRSFSGSLFYLGKTIRKLSQLCHPLRPLIKITLEIEWNEEFESNIHRTETHVAIAVGNSHYKTNLETWIKCNTLRMRLGASLDKRSHIRW